MKNVFISGIPTAGKSHLADKIAKITGAVHFNIDDFREEMRSDPKFKQWIDFFADQDEKKYWEEHSHEERWENMKRQSEGIWPFIKNKINDALESGQVSIFEGVNLLPHLISEIDIDGIYLLGESEETVLERNRKDPRWGETEELLKKQSESFFQCERPMYKKEAEKHGFKTFTDSDMAEKELLNLMEYKK
jgi:2-phosphoglycerate kinase